MWFNSLRASWKPWPTRRRRQEPRPTRRGTHLALEQLETRLTLSLTALASFDGTDGALPLAGVIVDSSGNLFGTTQEGGASGDGAVFELAHGSDTITTLASFNGTNGANPEAGLIMDSSGNLYGTTFHGGPSGSAGPGTVFELAKGSGTITLLASFNGTNGTWPRSSLVMDSSGNLYGTTIEGGSRDGTVFELAKGSGTITALALFNGANGEYPEAGLVMDSSGNLYGTTYGGGASNDGTVFELVHGKRGITTLASFNATDGAILFGGVVMDSSGNLYGTTWSGGGTVFELAQGSGKITTLASFNGTDGANPKDTLIMDIKGNLYGTTTYGGASSDGTVFELAKGSGTITALASFNGTDGALPEAGVIMDSSGNLYGTATGGGASDNGTVFELTGADVGTGQEAVVNSSVNTQSSESSSLCPGAPPYPNQISRNGTLTTKTTGGNLVLVGIGASTVRGAINEAGTNSILLDNVAAVSIADGGIIAAQGPAKSRFKP